MWGNVPRTQHRLHHAAVRKPTLPRHEAVRVTPHQLTRSDRPLDSHRVAQVCIRVLDVDDLAHGDVLRVFSAVDAVLPVLMTMPPPSER